MRRLQAFMTFLLVAGWMIGCSSRAATPPLDEPLTVDFDSPLHFIVVEARIHGEGPFRFLLDSGTTSTIVDVGLARRLKLDLESAATRGGTVAGSSVTTAPIEGGLAFELAPDLEVRVDSVIAAPVTEGTRVMLGERLDGILGSAIFFQYVVEVDYERRRLTLHDADRFRYEGTGSRLNLHFRQEATGVPFLRVDLANGDAELMDYPISIDSGGQAFGVGRLATRGDWDRLLQPTDRVVEVMGATGLSNETEGVTHGALMVQADRFVMGPFEFDDAVMSYTADGPTFASMGASLLYRFTAIFDYRRKQLILEPNAHFDDPPLLDRSGLFLILDDSADDAFSVFALSPGTPAEDAGLQHGDLVLSVDGVPAAEIGLTGVRLMFSRSQKYRLGVRRDGQPMTLLLETRPLF